MAAAEVVHVNVGQMIDLAIGNPEVGVVDFNMLQSVLHVLAQQLHVLNKGVELRGAAPPPPAQRAQSVNVTEFILQTQDQAPVEMPPTDASPQTMLVVERIRKGDGWTEGPKVPPDVSFKGAPDEAPERRLSVVTLPEFQKLEQSVDKIHAQVFGGPTNGDLLEEMRAHPGSKSLTDMWTNMNWSSRIETLEAGLQKLSSLMQDLAGEYVVVQESLSPNKSAEMGADGGPEAGEGLAGAEAAAVGAAGAAAGPARGPRLANEVEQLRADVERLNKVLGDGGGGFRKLKDKVEGLDKRFRKVCEKISQMDGDVGDQLNSFQDQLVGLGDDIASVNENLSGGNLSPDVLKDVQGIGELFDVVKQMQSEMGTLREAAACLALEKEERAHNLDVLLEQIELLKTIKMDREDMAVAMAEKADARLLARKVSHDQFETACDDLSRGVDTALSKLTSQETLWQQALDDIQREIDCKLDKLEMAPVKQFFCDKLRQLQDNLRQMALLRREAEAAGTKKKFLRDVNCISCDARAVMAMAEATMLPAGRAMPAPQLSMKPYLTYELDQIRKQQAAGGAQRNMHDWETIDKQSKPPVRVRSEAGKHLCNRYCGGSHTVTTPAQRVARLGHFLKQWGPDVMPLPPTRDESAKPTDQNQGAAAPRGSLQKGSGDKKKERPYGECRCIDEEGAKA